MPKSTEKSLNYFQRLQKIRQDRIEKRVGKRLIVPEHEMLQYIDKDQVPTMIQHCVLKVRKKVSGQGKESFISAFNICTATFRRYGYLSGRGMKMTGKGIKRNREHQREKEASGKKARYNGLVRQLWTNEIKRMKEADANKGKLGKAKESRLDDLNARREKRRERNAR